MLLRLFNFSGFGRKRGLFSLRLIVRTATVVVCIGLVAIAATLLSQARERSLKLAESTTRNLVGMLTQHTERTFDSVDMLLKIVARELGPRPEDPVKRSDLSANLAKLAQDLPHVMSVRMLDPDDGEPLFEFFRTTATGHGADADALQVHKANRYLGLYVGKPYLDRQSQTWLVGVSRRISGQEGVPGRVVVALLNLEYLNSFYASIAMGDAGSISIIRDDGIMIARRPFDPSYIGKDVSKALHASTGNRNEGNYNLRAPTDNMARIYAFRKLVRTPVVITAGLSEQAVLAEWREEATRGMSIVLAAVLILLVLGEILARVAGYREKAERELIHAASNDALTDLANRAEFQRRLETTLREAPEFLCVLFIDLDEFKTINDTLGHDAGDSLLIAAARRLAAIATDIGFLARLGGDEFAIAVRGTPDLACETAQRVLATLSRPFDHNGQTVMTAGSIGIAVFPDHGSSASDLLKNADIALYSAKANGRARYAVFETSMRTEIEQRIALHEDVKRGMQQDLFVPHYQPQISIRTGLIQGFEALARWRHPERGLLSPAVFGSAFDNHELAIAMGRKLFLQILADTRQWIDTGLPFGRVAVNASAAELDHPDYASWMLKEMAAYAVPPDVLEVEVTEGVLFGKTIDRVQANLLLLHRAGIRIALDDFGTGYASLTHLKQFPISVLKIDRSFVNNVENNGVDTSIVRAVIDMARGLKMEVVAEGVERPYQVDFLKKTGCTGAQGYLFAKPMPASRVSHFIQQRLLEAGPSALEARA
jgi:diguanylate cyclase (GGDEF)-like protein